jgi:hypothetical protein
MPWSYIYWPYIHFYDVSPILYYDTIFFENMKYKKISIFHFTYICYNVYMHDVFSLLSYVTNANLKHN